MVMLRSKLDTDSSEQWSSLRLVSMTAGIVGSTLQGSQLAILQNFSSKRNALEI
jgi:hypothetical protein